MDNVALLTEGIVWFSLSEGAIVSHMHTLKQVVIKARER